MARGNQTQEEYLKRCKSKHGDTYDYSEVEYTGSMNKVFIICKEHGGFSQRATSHALGDGCPKCFGKAGINQNVLFERKARLIHREKYSYSNVEYVNAKTKVNITCKIHGNFLQTPASHLSGNGCKKCADTLTGDRFRSNLESTIQRFAEVHGEKYDYRLIDEYTNCRDKIDIICKTHGTFTLTIAHHLVGIGCSKCAEYGFNKGMPANLYILHSRRGCTTKIGITNRSVEARLQEINRSSKLDFTINKIYSFETGDVAYKLEKEAIKWLTLSHKAEDALYDGSTECFKDVDLNLLTDFVENHLSTEFV